MLLVGVQAGGFEGIELDKWRAPGVEEIYEEEEEGENKGGVGVVIEEKPEHWK